MNIKKFINTFDFINPDWSTLPEGFPNVRYLGLTVEEKHLLEAIEIAWYVSQPVGFHARKMLVTTAGLMTFIAVLMGAIMVSYYVNVEYKLGFTFLTEIFA